MRKVFGGKSYDTDTATRIGSFQQGHRGDRDYLHESLYLTKGGQWFVAGESGDRGKYGTSDGNTTGGGSDMEVLTGGEAEALQWCETNEVDADIIIKYFKVIEA